MSSRDRLSFAPWVRKAAVAAGGLFIFGGALAYFVRFTFVVYYSYQHGLPNNLWEVLHSATDF